MIRPLLLVLLSILALHQVKAGDVVQTHQQLPIGLGYRPWPTIDAGVLGNMQRGLSLPSSFGLTSMSDKSWKYFASSFHTTDKENYSLFLAVIRQTTPVTTENPTGQLGICMFSMTEKSTKTKWMTVNAGYGYSSAVNPFSSIIATPVSDYSFFLQMQNCALLSYYPAPIGRKQVDITFKYVPYSISKTAPVGSIGAVYNLHVYDATNNITVDLNLEDQRGTVLEGSNGNVATFMSDLATTGRGIGSYEYGNPRLSITSGTVLLNGKDKQISKGNLFLDHQEIYLDIFDLPKAGSPLYTGYWIQLTLDDGRSIVTVTFYQGGASLFSGSKYNASAITRSFGTIYYPVTDSEQGFKSVGVKPLFGTSDFTFNLKGAPNKVDPNSIFTSLVTGKRYGTEFEFVIFKDSKRHESDDKSKDDEDKGKSETFYLKYFASDPEIYSTLDPNGGFAELACDVYSDSKMTKHIGTGFVEQMGRTAN